MFENFDWRPVLNVVLVVGGFGLIWLVRYVADHWHEVAVFGLVSFEKGKRVYVGVDDGYEVDVRPGWRRHDSGDGVRVEYRWGGDLLSMVVPGGWKAPRVWGKAFYLVREGDLIAGGMGESDVRVGAEFVSRFVRSNVVTDLVAQMKGSKLGLMEILLVVAAGVAGISALLGYQNRQDLGRLTEQVGVIREVLTATPVPGSGLPGVAPRQPEGVFPVVPGQRAPGVGGSNGR